MNYKRIVIRSRVVLHVIMLTLSALILSCTVPNEARIKDGRVYCVTKGLFKGRWYHYYEKALSCIEGEFYKEALNSLETAISKRENDKRLARTYGGRFINYFPNREMGMVHYLTGNYDQAKMKLEQSINQEPSAKAYYYLDQVRRHFYIQDKQLQSKPIIKTDPITSLITLNGKYWTNKNQVIISGFVDDELYVSDIWLNNEPYILEFSSKKVYFKKNIYLRDGMNTIAIKAKNIIGGITQKFINITVDRSGPLIMINQLNLSSGKITGELFDESGDIIFNVDNEKVPIKKGKQINFHLPLIFTKDHIMFLATDILGNQTQLIIEKKLKRTLQSKLLASTTQQKIFSDSKLYSQLNVKAKQFNILVDKLFDNNCSFDNTIRLNVTITNTTNSIERLLIDGRCLKISPSKNIICFSEEISLKIGKNNVRIEAIDSSGKVEDKTISITRKISSPFKYENRYRIWIQDFDCIDSTSNNKINIKYFCHRYKDLFLNYLKKKRRFKLGCKDSYNGRMLGEINKTKNGTEITIELYGESDKKRLTKKSRVDNNKIVKDIYSPSNNENIAIESVGKLYNKLHDAFPLLNIPVNNMLIDNDKLIIVTQNHKAKIRKHWPVIIYRAEKSSKCLGYKSQFVNAARIFKINNDGYIADIIGNYKIKTNHDNYYLLTK